MPKRVANPNLETVACIKARMVELELLEQALNEGRSMVWFLAWRLQDLKERMEELGGDNK